MLTVAGYVGYMRHALGKTPDSRHVLLDTLNAAGRYLFQCHDWTWKMTGPVDLVAKADQDWITLPVDFQNCVTIYIDNTDGNTASFTSVQQVDLLKLTRFKQDQFDNTYAGAFYINFPLWTQPSQGQSQMRAFVYPTPETDGQPTMKLIYNRRWKELDDPESTEYVNIPVDFEQTLKLLCRAFALRMENPESDSADRTMMEANLHIDKLKGYDGQRQIEQGPLSGGVNSRTQLRPDLQVGIATL